MKIVEIRPIEGANVYCHRPVVKVLIDLESIAETATNEIPGFTERLTRAIPTLHEHFCSRGRPGGFVERLHEGTYLGHVVEHVILELQHLAGFEVVYGKTVRADGPGMYYVITEYESKEGCIQALRSSVEIVRSLISGRPVDVDGEITKIKNAASHYGLGPSTGAVAKEALKRGIPVTRLGEGSILQLGYGKYQQKVEATITGSTKCIGVDIACDKVLVKQLLSESGIPVPWGGVARTAQEALDIAAHIGEAVVVKPFDGNQGKGVALNLKTHQELVRAMEVALSLSPKAIVEKYIKGKHYRLTVVGERVVAASERIPAFVVGDGTGCIRELVDAVNRNPLRGEDHEKPLTKIKIDPIVIMVLAKKGYTPATVPREGEIVYLRENANLSTGGIAVDVTGKVNPETVHLVLRAVRLVGLDVAGVDMVVQNIEKPLSHGNGAVIEINACPGIRMHHYPAKGTARNVAGAVVDMLFPPGVIYRIPIVSVTGTNGKTTVTRLVSHILQGTGRIVGTTTTDGIYVNGRRIVAGDTTGPRSAQVILRDPAVEVAVFETARGGILRSGLGYDYSDVGIITNISADHLGLDGVESLEEMAHVKAVVAEAVEKKGTTVLNADDLYVASMAKRIKSNVIYFSGAADNIIVRRHLGVGGTAVFVKNGYVVVAKGTRTRKVLPVKHIPCTFNGLAQHNLQNALAGVAGSIALGTEIEYIREGLLSFVSDGKCNPGRFNVFELGRFRLVVDYGHNVEGYKNTLQTIRKMKPNRIIGIIGVPGDRRDESIYEIGRTAAGYCDTLIIKEDSDLRGRTAGEVAEILKKAAMESGKRKEQLEIILSEPAAAMKGLAAARDGDIVVVFYEKLEPIMDIISKIEADTKPSAESREQETTAMCKNIG